MPLGSLIAAGSNLLSGFFGRSAQKSENDRQNAHAAAEAARQREFAQSGIQWKVEDARKAGIHPVYALGAPTSSPSPISLGGGADTSMSTAMGNMGQDIGRAVNATRSGPDPVYTQAAQKLALEKGFLENQLLASQIRKMNTTSPNPPMPWPPNPQLIPGQAGTNIVVPYEDKLTAKPRIVAGGKPHLTSDYFSPAEVWSQQYGDVAESLMGIPMLVNDLVDKAAHPLANWVSKAKWPKRSRLPRRVGHPSRYNR